MSTIKAFVEALKAHLASCGKSMVCEGDPWAHGDTEAGFHGDQVLDLDALEAEIDAFAATFIKENP